MSPGQYWVNSVSVTNEKKITFAIKWQKLHKCDKKGTDDKLI